MRNLTTLLIQAAALITGASGCMRSTGSCDNFVADQKDMEVAPTVACGILAQSSLSSTNRLYTSFQGSACRDACGVGFEVCEFRASYVEAYLAAQPDGGAATTDADVDGGAPPTCPSGTTPVPMHCSNYCEGRRTDGIDEPNAPAHPSLGDYFAACSYLEAVSMHAFTRLAAELEAHEAPAALIERARRASREESRHAELTASLARRFGVEPEVPIAAPEGARPLCEIAHENAVEGCVRETYGAALALVRAARSNDAQVRAALASIAPDECGHAELSWEIAAWAMERLTVEQRGEIEDAMREAAAELRAGSDDVLDADGAAVAGMPTRAERRRLAAVVGARVFRGWGLGEAAIG